MTYIVSSGTLNPTILYYTILYLNKGYKMTLLLFCMVDWTSSILM